MILKLIKPDSSGSIIFAAKSKLVSCRNYICFFVSVFFHLYGFTQQADTLPPVVRKDSTAQLRISADSVRNILDTLVKDSTAATDSLRNANDTLVSNVKTSVAENKENNKLVVFPSDLQVKQFNGQELMFYILLGLLIFFAVMKLLFEKYFTDLFRVYFRTTLKQTQVREQLLQTPLPSLLLNVFFIVTGGMYAAFLLKHFKIAPQFDFWQSWLYAGILLAIIYMMKFTGIKIAGWLFNRNDAATSYIFIVFMNNKIIGIGVLPFLILLAFGNNIIYAVALVGSVVLIACLFVYRFYLNLGVVRNQMKINLLQFFLYLSAFEIVPLLILFKWVMKFLK